jgi:alpha-1,2-glucosyltransferase
MGGLRRDARARPCATHLRVGMMRPDETAPARGPRTWAGYVVPWLVCLAAFAAGVLSLRGMGPLSDERHHMLQIGLLRAGDFRLVDSMTTLPSYHAAMAGLARLFGVSSLDAMRLLTLLGSVALIAVVFAIARRTAPAQAGLRTLQVLFLPILSPVLFLVYTDVWALLFLCAGLLATLHRRFLLAGVLAGVSVAFRQSQIVWLVMIWALCLAELGGLAATRDFGFRALRTTWTFGLAALAFVGFVVWNGGVAMGDRSMHPSGGLYLGNLYFILLLFFVLLLPLCIQRSSAALEFVSTRPWWIAGLYFACLYFLVGFEADHPYNQPQYGGFLHNQIILAFTATSIARVAFSAAVTLAFLVIATVPLQQRAFLLLYPTTVLALLPVWMIEQRYYLASFTLFLLFRKSEPPWLERILTLWLAFLSFLIFGGIRSGSFFP